MLKIEDVRPGTRIKIRTRTFSPDAGTKGTITEVYDDPDPTIGKMFVIKFDTDPDSICLDVLEFNVWGKYLEVIE